MNTTPSPDLLTRVETIFHAAIELRDPAKRAAYLDLACDGDLALRARLENILAADDDSFFERPIPSGWATAAPLAAAASPIAESAAMSEQIGRYKLLQKIGEGGCGVVYMAEQFEPVRRQVALKVIKLGMDTKSVIARFEAERQALALMDHPNIAKVLDAGATDAGRPYFVMELVRGVKITRYCDESNLSTRERLDLFIKVCQAIQHAHQKGIIHRDIKPSNILVTLNDGVAVPKVIDFGIAKATEGRLTDKTLFTQFEALVGTPAYMSPEQAVLTSLDIDTRSDIYSLGVLLYELLAGSTPFDGKELMDSGLEAMRKTIREKEPVRPSAKLSQTLAAAEMRRTSGGAEDSAASRRRVMENIHQIEGDLDWIVVKCLEKDRARRYETANGLASDIQRHLNNEAVLARPPSAAYWFQKLVRRNKLTFAAAAVVTLTMIAGLGFSTWAFLRESEQRALSDKNAEKARQAEQKAETALVEAGKAINLASERAAEITRNLYYSEMNLAGSAAAEPGGISRIADLTSKWLPQKGASDQRGWEWYYLRSVLRRDVLTLSGHNGHVKSVAWSPNGKNLASGSWDNTIKVWDVASRQVTLTLVGHKNGVNSVSWSPNGQRLGSGSEDSTIKIWDSGTGTNIRTLTGHPNRVNSIAWSPDGQRLASGSDDKTIKIWDAESWTNIRTLTGHIHSVKSVAWSPDGKRLASGSTDGSIKIWEGDGGQVIHTLTGHPYWVNSVSWNPDGKRLASGGADYLVRVWDVVYGTQLTNIVGHFDNVSTVSWSPDGNYLASGREDNTVRVQDMTSGTNTIIHRGHNKYVFSVSWSPDGKQLASGSEDGAIKFWNGTREETLTLRGHTDRVDSVAWSPDGRAVISGSDDRTIKIWDPDSGQESRTLHGHTATVASVAWSPDGKSIASGSQDRTVKIWNMLSGLNFSINQAHNQYSSGVSWSPDGKQVASVSEDNVINLYNAATGHVTLPLCGHSNTVHSTAWSPDGKFLASGSWDQTVRIWDALSGTNIYTLHGDHFGGYSSVAWSPDGKYLAAGAFDKTVQVWEAVNGQMIHVLRGHSGGVLSVSWSPDGNRLASASFDCTVKVWDVASEHETITLRGHTFAVQSVAWSPDGRRLASGGHDHLVKIWDARKGYTSQAD